MKLDEIFGMEFDNYEKPSYPSRRLIKRQQNKKLVRDFEDALNFFQYQLDNERITLEKAMRKVQQHADVAVEKLAQNKESDSVDMIKSMLAKFYRRYHPEMSDKFE